MIPYIIFVILVFLFRGLKKPLYIYLTLVLFSVLRYDTGWDYMSYIETVKDWGTGLVTNRYSFIWEWVFVTAQKYKMPHLAVAIPGFFTITLLYYVVTKIQINPREICDSLTIYALWPFFYLGSFATVRQSLAISIGLVMFYCAIKNKIIAFFLLFVLNIIIHPSSVICVCYAFFFKKDFHLKSSYMVAIVVLVMVAMASMEWIINNVSFLWVYSGYIGTSKSFGSKLSVLLLIIMIPTLMLRKKKIVSGGILDVCIVALIILICTLAFMPNATLARLVDYYAILLIFVAPNYKVLFTNHKDGNVLVYGAFTGLFLVYLLLSTNATSDMATSPYVPYKFIFLQ